MTLEEIRALLSTLVTSTHMGLDQSHSHIILGSACVGFPTPFFSVPLADRAVVTCNTPLYTIQPHSRGGTRQQVVRELWWNRVG